MAKTVIRVAMWSGPRNISTAMMRAWENRSDTFVSDEPFYAHYLAHTKAEHPGYKDILKSQPTDWPEVVEQCLNAEETDKKIHYQKHMTHHVLPHITLEWLRQLTNVFLIRSPAAVVASYSRSRPDVTAEDLGFEQQARLFKAVQRFSPNPLVINSDALLRQPQIAMKKLCDYCNIPFEKNMLQWPAGKRNSDGVWAPYWYHSVEQSTGFGPPKALKTLHLNPRQQQIADYCQPYYDALAEYATEF